MWKMETEKAVKCVCYLEDIVSGKYLGMKEASNVMSKVI